MLLPGSRRSRHRSAGARCWLSEGPRIATWVLALGLGVQAAFIVTDLAGTSRKPAAAAAAPRRRARSRWM